jgi:8-amino-7-oxononanoate synthase
LQAQGWDLCGSASQIIPLRIGSSAHALKLAANLADDGLFVPAIRPPAVPAGGARLRLSLSWLHSREQLQSLIAALSRLRP